MTRQPQGGRTSTTIITTHPSNNNKNKKRKASSTSEPSTGKKQQKNALPLKGMTLSVSTLKEGTTKPTTSNTSRRAGQDDKDDVCPDEGATAGYQQVCQSCHELGAQVTNQVSQRVHVLLCTQSAVESSTQRVRKAYKKKIPIVDVAWLEACQREGKAVDMGPFRWDAQAKAAIELRREKNHLKDGEPPAEVNPNAGWTEGVSFGCSCICHENGSEKDCPWCSNGCAK